MRKEAKDHGVTGRIAGALQPGDRVVITEDTVTRGTSLIEAVDVVSAAGAELMLITAIVDRGGTCAALAAEAGIAYVPLLTAGDLGFESGDARGPQDHRLHRSADGTASSNNRASARPMPSAATMPTAREPNHSPTGSRCNATVKSALTNATSHGSACRPKALPQSASGQIPWNGDGASSGSSGDVRIHAVVAPGPGRCSGGKRMCTASPLNPGRP